ncbi:kinesin-like protein KIN-14L [Cornus florida]|uniref:kinesin-like protein KIN-14L n=1 Tax=Cornus florida TaxID=4283 RepID=UPI002897B787|nr:kinesin-like protein KIN-14L [Cornus florida]
MEDPTRRGQHDLNLASRKAEEAAWRRFQATQWLDCLVGPLGISTQPSEREFISCLRNGLILCYAINKIQPGSVPKVVEIHLSTNSLTWDSQPLPAYQYFENVRNFLVAVEELKLPAFEASDLERDNLEVGSSTKVVDCILALKAYHEWKQTSGGNGIFKPPRSPLVMLSASRIHSRAPGAISSDPCRRLEMSAVCEERETQKLEASIVSALAECMVDMKENIDNNLLASFHNADQDPVELFSRIMSSCLDEHRQNKFPELESLSGDIFGEGSSSLACLTSTPLENSISIGKHVCCRACLKKGNCNHWHLFQVQEKELSNIKELLSSTKREFKDLQSQLQSDLKQLGSQVQELSTAALGYHKVVKENRNLYNMVQDLKGNIQVYCRIRPSFSAGAKNVIDFIGDDGSLVVLDPSKSHKDGRKVFQFSRVFGPTASQDEVFRDAEPLIRSVIDGYNVCILAYGQTGSGKTHTMCGPFGGSAKEPGINYLALNDLFELSNRRKDIIKYDIHVQMVEIYNEQVRDLLVEDSSSTKLEIRSCTSESGLNIPDATMHSVKSTTDAINLMKLGEVNRSVSSTAINNRSSRSHSILTVHVHGKDVSGSILRSCLHLVDLAGSERVDKSEVTGEGLKEAQYINRSLSCLGDVITALAQKNSHIPYRNSKLTLLLQNSLGGHAKTLMFAHVSPEGDSFGETMSTLKFAQRVSTVELGAARVNKESNEVMELKEQIENLKKALANKETRSQHNKPRERTPSEKAKEMAENTPPRPQRLNIENCSIMKMEKATNSEHRKGPKTPSEKAKELAENTPPRPQRLNIENCSIMKMEKATNSEHWKGPKTPSEKAKELAENTPPRPQRLNIENCSIMKMEKATNSEHWKGPKTPSEKAKEMAENSPPHPQRLNIENCSIMKMEKATNSEHWKGPKTPSEKAKEMAENSPPHPQRLNIENCSIMKMEKATNSEHRKGPKTPPVSSRSRRLSLEGPRYVNKEPVQIKISEAVRQDMYGRLQDAETGSMPNGHINNGGSIVDVYHQRASRSPTSSAYQSRVVKPASRKKIEPLQLSKTPEPPVHGKNEVQIVMKSELTSTESRTSRLNSGTNGKRSQIRKSLRTIGKLINGSEKRNQQRVIEVESSINSISSIQDVTSPTPANARGLRRQSLTGVQTSDRSRRSSLVGNSTVSCANETRNAKTPPPVRASSKLTRQWL